MGAQDAALQTELHDGARRSPRARSWLGRTRVTPNALTTTGVSLCLAASVLVYFEYKSPVFYWLGAPVFVIGSVLDILDGALARAGGKATPFGAFLDSTTDRIGEGSMLGAIALIVAGTARHARARVRAVAGSFLVSYTRARAEALGLRGDVGIGSRAERVVVITAGLVLAPSGAAAVARSALCARPPGSRWSSASAACASSCRAELAARPRRILLAV